MKKEDGLPVFTKNQKVARYKHQSTTKKETAALGLYCLFAIRLSGRKRGGGKGVYFTKAERERERGGFLACRLTAMYHVMRPQDFRVTNHFVPLHPIFGLFTNPMENMTEIFFFIFWEFLVSGNLTVCTREIPSYPFLSDKIYSYCFLFLLGWFPSIRKICVSLRRGYFYTFQAFFLSFSLPDDFVLYHLLFNQQE